MQTHHFRTLADAAVLTGDPDATALVCVATGQPPITVSRGVFRHEAGRWAAALRGLGVAPRDLVIVAAADGLAGVYAFWGALLLGAIPSMFPTLTEKLDPDHYLGQLAQLVALSEVRAVLTTASFAGLLVGRVGCLVVTLDALEAAPAPDDLAPPAPGDINPDAIALLQHSSGTTGLQKGVALTHQAVLGQLDAYADALGLREADVIVSWLPLYHDMGLIAGFLLPLVYGVPLVLTSPFDWVARPAMLYRAISDYGGTLCWQPNFAYHHAARRARDADLVGVSLGTMRAFINCSEPVYDEAHRVFLERFGPYGARPEMLSVCYALAENVFAATQTPVGSPPRVDWVDGDALARNGRAVAVAPDHARATAKVSCGPPIAGTTVRILGDDGVLMPERVVGEIALHSPYLLKEYYRRPDLTPLLDGWYRTGDRGYLADGELYVVGRAKDLIINAGKNLYPQDIEVVASSVPGVIPGRAVAFGVYDPREGTEVIALVAELSPDADTPDARATINRALRGAILRATGVALGYVTLVSERWLLKTSSGKIARAANRDKWLAERAGH